MLDLEIAFARMEDALREGERELTRGRGFRAGLTGAPVEETDPDYLEGYRSGLQERSDIRREAEEEIRAIVA